MLSKLRRMSRNPKTLRVWPLAVVVVSADDQSTGSMLRIYERIHATSHARVMQPTIPSMKLSLSSKLNLKLLDRLVFFFGLVTNPSA